MDDLGPQLDEFRSSSRAIFGLSGLMMVALLPGVARRVLGANDLSLLQAFAAFGTLLLVPIPLWLLLAPFFRFFGLRVHELGLKGFDGNGRRRSVRWPIVTEVATVGLPGLRFTRVRTTEPGVVIYLPQFLDRPHELERLVRQLAGPGHPLVAFYDRMDG